MRALAAVVMVGGLLVAGPFGPASPAEATDGSCTDATGVTIVIDFQELGGGVNVRCAPGPVTTGLDAMRRADISYQTTIRFSGFVCKIAGKPSNDPCIDTSPATAYWSYWLAPRGGQWCYSNLGAGNRRPPPGTVEAWSFSLDKTESTSPPPRYAVPPPFPGVAPAPLGANDCDRRSTAPTVPPTTAPVAVPSPTTPAAPPAAGGTARPAEGSKPPATTAPKGGTSRPTTTAPPVGAPTTIAPSAPATDVAPTSAPTPAVGEDAEVEGATETRGDETEAAGADETVGTVDLSSDGDDSSSAPVGVLIAVGLVAVLGAGAFTINRRRRSDPA